jgi:hypothetical protein
MTEHTVTLTAEEYARFLMQPTLRDQFAMAALTGLSANPQYDWTWERMAEHAYIAADAMLETRKEKK